jgi:hypothetical protein
VANDYHNLAHLCKLRSNTFVYVRDEKVQSFATSHTLIVLSGCRLSLSADAL